MADPSRRFRMLGYWSVSQRNILGMPKRAVVEPDLPQPVDDGGDHDDDDDDGDDGDDGDATAR